MSMKRNAGATVSSSDLGSTLAAFHARFGDWDGVPTAEHLAMALRCVRDSYLDFVTSQAPQSSKNFLAELKQVPSQMKQGPSRRQELDHLRLLDAVAAAIADETVDGWKLRLSGRKGRRATSDEFIEKLEIAAFIMKQMDARHGYDSAVVAAKEHFGCKTTKAAQAYSEYKSLVDELMRIDDLSPEHAVELFARARANPRTGQVR